jgi:peroxiredoxin
MQDGMQAPDISGVTVDGQPVRLSDHRGQVVAVVFFADWCPHCRALYPTERELAQRMKRGPFLLIGVDSDNTPDEIRSAIRREDITWPVVDDADGRNAAAWGVTALPTVYVLDAAGTIRAYNVTGRSLLSAVDALIAGTRTAP